MNKKTFLISILTAFLVIASIGIASATDCLSLSSTSVPSSVTHNAGTVSFTFLVANNQSTCSTAKTGINLSVTDTSGKAGAWTVTPSTIASLERNNSQSVTATAAFAAYQSGSITPRVTLAGDDSENETLSLSIPITSSSTITASNVQSLTKTQNGIINITNTGNIAMSVNLTYSGAFNISLSGVGNPFALNAGQSQLVTVTALANLSALEVGSHTVTITAKDLISSASASQSYAISSDFCEYQNINDSLIDITDIEDSSDDPWEWNPLDNIEISLEVENNLDDDEDFVVELGLYDTTEHEFIEIDGEDSLEQDLSLDEGDADTVTFEFEAPIELEESTGRYIVFVKAYVEGEEDSYCNSYTAENVPDSEDNDAIKVERNDNDVIVNEEEIDAPDLATAGELVKISAKVYNIGTEDEDKVKVTLTNTKLGLDLESDSFSLDSEDSETVDFSFVVPQNIENGIYTFKLDTYFDYSSSSDNYREESEDSWDVAIKIIGGTNTTLTEGKAAAISASLDTQEVNPGSDINLTVTIKNLNEGRTTFSISLLGLESWAEVKSISSQVLTLDGGESKNINIALKINDSAPAGEHTFTLETIAGSKKDSKIIAVNVESSSVLSSLLSSIKESKNSLLWVFGIASLIILIVIVVLWIRISRNH